MKANLEVYWDNKTKTYEIKNISSVMFKIFGFDGDTSSVIGTTLSIPKLISHLDMLRDSTVQFIEFLYTIGIKTYSVKIVKDSPISFLILFSFLVEETIYEPIDYDKDTSIEFFEGAEKILTNDKALDYTYNFRDRSKDEINLEVLYTVRAIKEQIKEDRAEILQRLIIQTDKINILEKESISQKDISIFNLIKLLGIGWMLLFILCMALFNQLIAYPLTKPIVNFITNQTVNSSND